MARLYINLSLISTVGIGEVEKMIETMPGGEPIILEKVPALLYCGGCMAEMRCIHGSLFACPICGMNYTKKMSV